MDDWRRAHIRSGESHEMRAALAQLEFRVAATRSLVAERFRLVEILD